MSLIDLSRRRLLAGATAAAGAAAAGAPASAQPSAPPPAPAPALPAYVGWKDAGAMIVHSNNTLETVRGAFGVSPITPTSRLYVRNNVGPPSPAILADRDGWQVSIEGVKTPRALTVRELKTMGVETVTMVLQCSGNGRAYFEHKPAGTPWQVGAAGCVMWTGVPLRAVVAALGGLADGARFVTATGGEVIPRGLDPKSVIVERSVPLEALDSVLLAWDLNGEPIPLAHGGPLRTVVPGYAGVNSIKYVKTIAFTAQETDAAIHRVRYRVQPVGQEEGPAFPSVWKMNVKSWITAPLTDRASGQAQITGVAFGGFNAVRSVEVSIDGGRTWTTAPFIGPDLGRYAWRPFALTRRLAPGRYTLVSRATDSKGVRQPEMFEPNGPGYNHNGWRAPAVEITVA